MLLAQPRGEADESFISQFEDRVEIILGSLVIGVPPPLADDHGSAPR